MKSTKEESILDLQALAGTFLKDRQYINKDFFDGKAVNVIKNPQVMAMNSIVKASTRQHNTIAYIDTNFTFSEADEQYRRFLDFVRDSSEPYKSEITHLLFPIFVNIYIELIYKGESIEAQKFFHYHCDLYAKEEGYKDVIQDLRNLITVETISNHPYFKLFRKERFNIIISEDAIQYFIAYLKEVDNLILLQIINSYFCIETDSSSNLYSEDELDIHDFDDVDDSENSYNSSLKLDSPILKLSPLEELQMSIKNIREGCPSIPSSFLYTLKTDTGPCSVNLSMNSSLLAAGYESSEIHLWSLNANKLVSHPAPTNISHIYLGCDELKDEEPDENLESYEKILKGHGGAVYGLSFTPCHQILLSCSGDTTVRAWSMKTFKNIVLYIGHNYPVWDIDTSSHYSYFATASKDHTARLWTTDCIYPIRIFAGHDEDVNCVKFHPNCNYIATGSCDASVRLWNVQSGHMVRVFSGHQKAITALAFSPNGQLLASAGEDYLIKIWDLGSSAELKELRGHKDSIYRISFNSDSSLLASGGFDNSLNIWDVRQDRKNTSAFTSSSTSSDSSSSPELLASLPTDTVSLHHVQFNKNSSLTTVGHNFF